MLKLKYRFMALLLAVFILMASSGIGIVAADDAGDNSTIVDEGYSVEETDNSIGVEETHVEETTTAVVDDSDDVIISSEPIEYQEENTEITSIDDSYKSTEGVAAESGSIIGDIKYTSDDDNSYTYSDDDNTTIGNNTEIYDNSYYSETYIQNTEITQVNMDNSKNVSIDVKNDNSVVNNVYFVPTKDIGKVNVVVEDIKDECLTKKPEGVVYKSFNIFIDNPEATIDNAAVDFKVEKSWLTANGIGKSDIILTMYKGGKWVEVPMIITSEDSKYIYFKAAVDEYSTFAITSKSISVDKVLKQTNTTGGNVSEEEIDKPTKNVIIKMLEFVIELLEEE